MIRAKAGDYILCIGDWIAVACPGLTNVEIADPPVRFVMPGGRLSKRAWLKEEGIRKLDLTIPEDAARVAALLLIDPY